MPAWPSAAGELALGDLALQSGGTLPAARLSWKTHGTLSPARDNAVLYPTSYGAQHPELEWLVGPDGVLDPGRWFIVMPDMFGNGLSSSPSNTPEYPPLVTAWDNVQAQRRLLAERFGVTRLACAYGWSMGAQQAFHWAALHPQAVERAVIVCGSARTAAHNRVFLSSLVATLEAAAEYRGDGRFSAHPVASLKAFARVYASWALSQDFYRAGLHGTDLERFLVTQWEDRWLLRDPANLLAQLHTWLAGDISANPLYNGDLPRALQAVEARMLLMPGETDLYFRVADHAAELRDLRHAELCPIPSIWGHRAGNPSTNPADAAFLRDHVRAWLAR